MFANGVLNQFIESLHRFKDVWKDKVEHGPKLREIVLQRGTCQNEAETGAVVLGYSCAQFRVRIFHSVAFVDDHVEPLDLLNIGRSLMMYS